MNANLRKNIGAVVMIFFVGLFMESNPTEASSDPTSLKGIWAESDLSGLFDFRADGIVQFTLRKSGDAYKMTYDVKGTQVTLRNQKGKVVIVMEFRDGLLTIAGTNPQGALQLYKVLVDKNGHACGIVIKNKIVGHC